MKKLGMVCLVCLSSCSTTRITYEVGDEIAAPVTTSVKETVLPTTTKLTATNLEREPDVKSVPATVTFDYPERVNPAVYKVVSVVNVRDFPSAKDGKIVGQLKPGETVVGNEVEGSWIRIYANSYTSLKSLRRVY